MKNVIKILFWLMVGCAIGLGVAIVAIVAFTDQSFGDVIAKLSGADAAIIATGVAVSLVSLAVSVVVAVTLHEAGHLAAGLMSGYRFVSFRVFNLTFIRTGRRLRVKRFAVAGTGGQCLLSPPDGGAERMPTTLYNLGGVAMNALLAAAAGAGLLMVDGPALHTFLVMLLIVNCAVLLLNGLPLMVGGMGNDGYNALMLRRNPAARRALWAQLNTNALIQEGVRPRDMPVRLFELPATVDYANALEVSAPLTAASRLLDMERYAEAEALFDEVYAHRDKVMQLYVNETACELAYLALVRGDTERARTLLTPKVRQYVESFRKVMTSKERLACAIALRLDGDRAAAEAIMQRVSDNRDSYLLQGEVASDLALMEALLDGSAEKRLVNNASYR